MAENMIIYALKGKIHMGEENWAKFVESLSPALPLLQCFADSSTLLGKCIIDMFNPDISNNIFIPYIEVLKGNLRFLYSPDVKVRKEAIYQLMWILEKEPNSMKKLPRLSSLQNCPLDSICILKQDFAVKCPKGNYMVRIIFLSQ